MGRSCSPAIVRSLSLASCVSLLLATVPKTHAQGACAPETHPIVSGQTLVGELLPGDCVHNSQTGATYDVYTFQAVAGVEYTAGLGALPNAFMDPLVVVKNPAGAVIATDDDGGVLGGARAHFTASTAGVYRIEVTSSGFGIGPYEVTLASGPCPPAATPILPGQSLSNRLSDADCFGPTRPTSLHDPYAFTAVAGSSYTIVMRTPASDDDEALAFDPYLVLRGPSGAVVAENDDGGVGWNSRIDLVAPSSGLFRIEATSAGPNTGTYEIELAEGPCPRPAQPIAIGQSLVGEFTDTDCASSVHPEGYADAYTLQATAGRQYRITMTSGTGGDPLNPIDPYLVVRDPAGELVAENDNGLGDPNALVIYTPPTSGIFVIEATTAIAGTGDYALTVQTVSCPSPPIPIAAGQTLSGTLATTDCYGEGRPGSYADRFAFAATAGTQYTVTVSSSTSGLFVIAILRDASGTVVGNSGGGPIVYSATAATTLTIEITTDNGGGTGDYTVSLAGITCPSASTPISDGQTLSGVLDGDDCLGANGIPYDRFVFPGTPDKVYKITVVSERFFDGTPKIVGDAGYTPFFGEPPNTRSVTFQPSTARPVQVDITTYIGGGTGGYTIRVEGRVCTSARSEISVGQTVDGTLDTNDCLSTYLGQLQPHYAETYTFEAVAGQAYSIALASTAYYPYFRLTNPAGATVVERGEVFANTLQYIYTAPVTGTHRIEVSSEIERWTGPYTLTLAAAEACQSSVAPISDGQSLTGSLAATDCYNASPSWATGSHYDRYTISLQAGVRYTIGMTTSSIKPLLMLRNAAGQVVTSEIDPSPPGSGFPGGQATVLYTAPSSGVYSIDVSSGTAGSIGDYTVSVRSNASCAGAVTAIAVGSTTNGALEATDCDSLLRPNAYRDLYSFAGIAGTPLRVYMDSFTVDPFLALYGPDGQVLATDDDGGVGDDARIAFTLQTSGTYTVETTAFQANWTGAYTLRLQSGSSPDCTPDVAPITLNSSTIGALAGSECAATSRPGSFHDAYTFQGIAGVTYRVAMASYEIDSYVAVLSPAGAVVAQNDDSGGGFNALLSFTASTTGTYSIEATTGPPDQVGFYEVSVYSSVPPAGDCTPVPTHLAIGQTLSGELTLGGCGSEIQEGAFHERYSFDATAGSTYRIYMQGTTIDPWIVLFLGDDGALVQGDDTDDGTANAEVIFTAPEAETYVFEATTAEPGQVGSYTVSVSEVEPPLARGGSGSCQTRTLKIAPGQKIVNTLSANDCLAPERPTSYHNRYSLPALAGASYTITMRSNALDARLMLVGPDGALVTEDDNGAGKLNARVAFTASADGVYTLVATTTGVQQRGRYDIAVAGRPGATVGAYVASTGAWFLRNSNASGAADYVFSFGSGGSQLFAITGDWDGNGTETPGLYDASTGAFFLRNANAGGGADVLFTFGAGGAGFRPLVGDWNGDGIDTIGLYNPVTGSFFLKDANTPGPADVVFGFGPTGVEPLAGDWDGNGRDSIGIFVPATATFFLKNSNAGGAADLAYSFGAAGTSWRPIAGDWNADGADTIGLYDPANAVFYLRDRHQGGAADRVFGYGPPNVTPLAGDWNGR